MIHASGREGGAEKHGQVVGTFHAAQRVEVGKGRARLALGPLAQQVRVEGRVVGAELTPTHFMHRVDALRRPRSLPQEHNP